jgi:hypothetical protein
VVCDDYSSSLGWMVGMVAVTVTTCKLSNYAHPFLRSAPLGKLEPWNPKYRKPDSCSLAMVSSF